MRDFEKQLLFHLERERQNERERDREGGREGRREGGRETEREREMRGGGLGSSCGQRKLLLEL